MREKAKIMAVCNQKGGVGKTLTAVSLGVGLARMDKRVLLVDGFSDCQPGLAQITLLECNRKRYAKK